MFWPGGSHSFIVITATSRPGQIWNLGDYFLPLLLIGTWRVGTAVPTFQIRKVKSKEAQVL